MENFVLYRKYRPLIFGEIINQQHVVKTLTNALTLGRVAHAYLFCGSRGTGKTTVARLLAKAVNCEDRKTAEPCNQCEFCKEINAGRAMDLVEIDAASNRGIDEIRELREGIRFAPVKLRYKVFIIDEVHMLTREAFNALLKTLEEPPAHAIFILATTEIYKVPRTIISRCQRFDFHKLALEKIVERLAGIAVKEGVKIERAALNLIAANAEGAARDAESLLGQVMAMEDKDITLKEARAILGVTDIEAAAAMADYILKKDLSGALGHINKIIDEGYDAGQFARSLVAYFRKMMIFASFGDKTDEALRMQKLAAPELTVEQFDGMVERGKKFSAAALIKIIKLFIQAEQESKSAILPPMPLELAIAEILNGESER